MKGLNVAGQLCCTTMIAAILGAGGIVLEAGCGTEECVKECAWDAGTRDCSVLVTEDSSVDSGVDPLQCGTPSGKDAVKLAYAKLLIEHNATDEDTGFQGALDGVPWRRLRVCGPEGSVLSIEAEGKMKEVGLTELFFETQEPPNSAVPIPDWLKNLPEGEYTFKGESIFDKELAGVATFTHAIPAKPVITKPAEGSKVSADSDLEIAWEPVTKTISGKDVTVTHYQLIVELVEPGWDEHHGFGASKLSVTMPASTTSMKVPAGFLQPGSPYEFEVLAIEESGNQTIAASSFSTN